MKNLPPKLSNLFDEEREKYLNRGNKSGLEKIKKCAEKSNNANKLPANMAVPTNNMLPGIVLRRISIKSKEKILPIKKTKEVRKTF